jgi:hypothetical protein
MKSWFQSLLFQMRNLYRYDEEAGERGAASGGAGGAPRGGRPEQPGVQVPDGAEPLGGVPHHQPGEPVLQPDPGLQQAEPAQAVPRLRRAGRRRRGARRRGLGINCFTKHVLLLLPWMNPIHVSLCAFRLTRGRGWSGERRVCGK